MEEKSRGFTVVELIVTIIVFGIISSVVAVTVFAYIGSSADSKLRASALTVASQHMEYLRSLPYDHLAVAGGSITGSSTYMPYQQEFTRAGRTFVTTTDIRYVDDAFDGCLNYGASQARYCKNYTASTVLSDTNPRDYKAATITVTVKGQSKSLASLSSHFTSRIAETGSNSAAILVRVLDSTGTAVNGAKVRIQNTTLSPVVDQFSTTDVNGEALFLDVVPDTEKDYIVSTEKVGYSSQATIAQNGSLIPTHPNVNAIAQKVSNVTLVSDTVSLSSLQVTVLNQAGAPLANTNLSLTGGVKLYTDPLDQTYSYTGTVTTDANGVATLGNLVPGMYKLCYLAQPNPCASGSSNQALTVWVAYGAASTQPFSVPAGTAAADGGPMQRAVVTIATPTSAPRLTTITPSSVSSSASDAATTDIAIDGENLSGAEVKLQLAGQPDIVGTVSGADTSSQIKRTFNVSNVAQGAYELVLTTANGQIRQKGVAPGTLGAVNVAP